MGFAKRDHEAEEAIKAADIAEEKLQKAMARPESEQDDDSIKILAAERDKTLEAAEKARRRAAKARVKADQATETLEDEDMDAGAKSDEVEP